MAPCWYLTCVIPGILWTLDELKRTLINKFPILEIEKGEDFKILFDLFVEWAEILLNYPFCWIWEIMAQNPSFKKFPVVYTYVVSYSRGVIALQRTPSHSIHMLTDNRAPQRGSYTRNNYIGRNNESEEFFLVSSFGGNIFWNIIIWNMGKILIFLVFFSRIVYTIIFH